MNNKITFELDESLIGIIPDPKPAGKYLPKYYKNLKTQSTDDPRTTTAKMCVPFMDAITAGYILPLWSDMYVKAKDGEIEIAFPEGYPLRDSLEKNPNNPLPSHSYEQLANHPASNQPYEETLLKFLNPWVVKTPPGVSCIFTSPMNHFETRFKLVDGIVDTDSYYAQVNFPFMWTGGDGEFLIEKGTPLVQIIPFVRYDFNNYKVKPLDVKKSDRTLDLVGSIFKHGYRKYFWHKRKK